MGFPFFTPKIVASALAGLGSMAGGGGAVYLYQMPRTWRELLIKEGFVFLSNEYEYKGMFNDQKEDADWKAESDVKQATNDDVKTKAGDYCTKKFKEALPSSSSNNYASTKRKLIAFCTTEGIKTVKGRLIQSKKEKWIDENNGDDKWKSVFAVYRYDDKFINWLKEDDPSQNSNLSKSSEVSEYSKLKNACSKLLKKNHKDIKDNKYFNYGSWWCVELGYETIEDKIKKEDSNWQTKEQSDSDWGDLKTKWEKTDEVKKWANKASGSSDDSAELTEDSLKKLCESTNVQSKLSDNDSYQEKYTVIRSVCKKSSS